MAKVGRAARNDSLMRTETVSADKTIGAAETGEVYFVDISASAANITITLPAAKAGAYFLFILSADADAAGQCIIDAGSGVTISGNTFVQAAGTAGDVKAHYSAQKIGFGDASKLGDRIGVISDGSNWLITECDLSVAVEVAFD